MRPSTKDNCSSFAQASIGKIVRCTTCNTSQACLDVKIIKQLWCNRNLLCCRSNFFSLLHPELSHPTDSSVLLVSQRTVVLRMFHQLHDASLSLSKLLLFFVQAELYSGSLSGRFLLGYSKAYLAGICKCKASRKLVV